MQKKQGFSINNVHSIGEIFVGTVLRRLQNNSELLFSSYFADGFPTENKGHLTTLTKRPRTPDERVGILILATLL